MTIRQQIESIIANRQKYQPEFVRYFEEVSKMRDFVNGVNGFKSNPGWLAMVNCNDKLKKEWDSLVSEAEKLQAQLQVLCDGDNGSLTECLKRVKRDYLNIGCVGPWRQGKSTVISKLTNLSDYVIPRSKFLTCTGTTINIFNGNQVVWHNGHYEERDGNKAVVYYHSYNSICKTINDYLAELKLGSMPYASTRDSFIQNCSMCYQTNSGKPGTDSKLKKMLDTYLLHAADYVDSLKPQDNMYEEITSLSSIESQKRLRPLVSYYEHTDAEYKEMGIQTPTQVFFVLAVKKVDIFTTFLVNGENGPEEVGKIQFVDTPGLGESKLEVADTLAKSLRSELDIAICLRKVSNQAGIIPNDSYDFHKVLKQNTYGRKPENWVFYLYNKEGNVADDILQTTFADVNNNLANTQEEGLLPGQIVSGIKLKYDLSNSTGNHIDFIDAENEVEKLEHYFMSILTEMSHTIADSDNAFYKEARDGYAQANNLYRTIISGSFRNVSQCLPTFDDREKIINTIKNVKEEWNETVKCPESLNANINKALANFYNESYGLVLANVLGVPSDAIDKLDKEIQKIINAKEMQVRQRNAEQDRITEATLLPYVEKKITQNAVNTHDVLNIFNAWLNKLAESMVNRALALIETTNVLQTMESVKLVLWQGLMNKGQLSFGKTNESDWLDYVLRLLKEGGNDFAALHDAILEFRDYRFNLKGVISEFIKASINQVVAQYGIPHSEGHDLKAIQKAVYKTLIMSESETKANIQTQCKHTVDGQLSLALNNFIEKVNTFEMVIIPSGSPFLTYNYEFEQLVKFYNKYSSEIFSSDELASQKLAVQEWNVLRLKFNN